MITNETKYYATTGTAITSTNGDDSSIAFGTATAGTSSIPNIAFGGGSILTAEMPDYYKSFADSITNKWCRYIIPELQLLDVKLIYDGVDPIGIQCKWEHDIVTKSIIQGDDVFDLETGLIVCIAKAWLAYTHEVSKSGNNVLYAYVKQALRILKKNDDKEKEEREKKKIIARKREYNKKRRAKRKQKRIEEQIRIQTEAYVKAMEIQKSKEEGLRG